MTFAMDNQQTWEQVEPGIERSMVNWNDDIMAVKVRFTKGAVGVPHSHVAHDQLSYVLAGSFEVILGEETRILSVGDSFLAQKNCQHGVVALEDGAILLDVFTPMRTDFIYSANN
ncbi:cupin domain-containing protein [Vibrio sp. TRT 21S02]|uniref:cupin domain-containing protein n=1 Tax=Vibrio sp. TRT 21S02 TaxID=3418507 RepID=UPI003CF39EE0